MPFCVHPENGTRRCRPCDLIYQREYQKKHPDKRRNRKMSPEQRTRASINSRRHYFRKVYDMSLEDFEALWDQQEGRCACCSNELQRDRTTHVDHCHVTGAIRGLLCHGCNTGMGLLGDDIERLQLAVEYLGRFASTGIPAGSMSLATTRGDK